MANTGKVSPANPPASEYEMERLDGNLSTLFFNSEVRLILWTLLQVGLQFINNYLQHSHKSTKAAIVLVILQRVN